MLRCILQIAFLWISQWKKACVCDIWMLSSSYVLNTWPFPCFWHTKLHGRKAITTWKPIVSLVWHLQLFAVTCWVTHYHTLCTSFSQTSSVNALPPQLSRHLPWNVNVKQVPLLLTGWGNSTHSKGGKKSITVFIHFRTALACRVWRNPKLDTPTIAIMVKVCYICSSFVSNVKQSGDCFDTIGSKCIIIDLFLSLFDSSGSVGSPKGWRSWTTWASKRWSWRDHPTQQLLQTPASIMRRTSPTLPFPPIISTRCMWLPATSWPTSSSSCCVWWETYWCVLLYLKTVVCARSPTSSSSTWRSVTYWLASSASQQHWWTTSSQVPTGPMPHPSASTPYCHKHVAGKSVLKCVQVHVWWCKQVTSNYRPAAR